MEKISLFKLFQTLTLALLLAGFVCLSTGCFGDSGGMNEKAKQPLIQDLEIEPATESDDQ